MTFDEILPFLNAGECVRNISTGKTYYHEMLDIDGVSGIVLMMKNPDSEDDYANLSLENLEGTWEVVE